jgi:hypothetical protein
VIDQVGVVVTLYPRLEILHRSPAVLASVSAAKHLLLVNVTGVQGVRIFLHDRFLIPVWSILTTDGASSPLIA